MQNQRGLSLIEVVAAVALLLVLLSVAVLRVSSLQQGSQLRAAAYRLAGDLRLAGQRATLEGVTWELLLDGPSGAASGYQVYFQAPNAAWTAYRFRGGSTAVRLPAGVVISHIEPPGGAASPPGTDGVQFLSANGAPPASTLFTLTAAATGLQVQVRVWAPTGFVEICDKICA